jgi:CRP/FNR family cyclic AMP-dependent transcriptional regulator
MFMSEKGGMLRGGYLCDSPYVVGRPGKYEKELSLLLSGLKVRTYHANEVVYTKGEVDRRFYFINSGKVQVTMSGPDGSEKIVAIHESNTFLGELGLDDYPNVATAVTLEESEIYLIKKSHFESCARRHPEVALMILESVIRKARNAAFQIGYLSLLNAKGRVAHMLLTLAHEIGTETEDGVVIGKRITHETLAGLTGLARPTLTSVLNDLERSRMIKTRNRTVTIIDKQGLSDVVEKIHV